MDRSGELRSQPEKLDQLWGNAQIIEVGKGRVRSTSAGLTYLPADQAIGGERYFLGISLEDNRAYFAWA